MSSITITIPESLRAFVEEQAARGGHRSVSDYLASILEEARRRENRKLLEAKLLEGIHSGPDIVADEAFWADQLRNCDDATSEEPEA